MTEYLFSNSENVITPALIYYKEILEKNTDEIIALAGDVHKLWPHVKSHKCKKMVEFLQSKGIDKFKCATIAEAEMVAECHPRAVLIAYPLVGPNISRAVLLAKAYPEVEFWVIGDNAEQIAALDQEAWRADFSLNFLVDVNMGQDRTGIEPEQVPAFVRNLGHLKKIRFSGLHCYDGNRHEPHFSERKALVDCTYRKIEKAVVELERTGYPVDVIVAGGSPSFPCYCDKKKVYFSPGTIFLQDDGYAQAFSDLPMKPAAAILTRVISNPRPGHFTLDLGYKAIAADPKGARGRIVGLEHYQEFLQNEEHWCFSMEKGYENACPTVGQELFVIPTHICPTSALYPSVFVVEKGRIVDEWEVTARNRKLMF